MKLDKAQILILIRNKLEKMLEHGYEFNEKFSKFGLETKVASAKELTSDVNELNLLIAELR